MTKFTFNLSTEQNEILNNLKSVLNASTLSEVLRKSISLALLYAETIKKGNKFCIVDNEGKILEVIRIL